MTSIALEARGWCDNSVIDEVVEQDVYRIREIEWIPRSIVDIGAHIGTFSALVAHRWPTARIIACEPDPDNFDLLARNTRRLENVVPLRLAVSDTNDSEQLFHQVTDKCQGNSGGGTCFRSIAGSRTIFVAATSAASLWRIQRINPCDVLKLDCEGAELAILENLRQNDLLGGICRIVGEWHALLDSDRFTSRIQDTLATLLEPTHQVSFFGHHRGTEGYFLAMRR